MVSCNTTAFWRIKNKTIKFRVIWRNSVVKRHEGPWVALLVIPHWEAKMS